MSKEVLKHANLADIVFDYVVKNIVSGKYHSSMRLTERQLASDLNVSRVPVREALQRLEHELWIVKNGKSSVYVRRFTAEDVKEIYQLREGIEGIACREAAALIDETLLSELAKELETLNYCENYGKNINADLTQSDKELYRQADMRFHELIVEASCNQRIKKVFQTSVLQSQCFFFLRTAAAMLGAMTPSGFSFISHQVIFNAIAEKNRDEAEKSMRQHLRSGCESILKVKEVLGLE